MAIEERTIHLSDDAHEQFIQIVFSLIEQHQTVVQKLGHISAATNFGMKILRFQDPIFGVQNH